MWRMNFLALGLILPFGCDIDNDVEREGIEQSVAALELSPNQDLVESEDSDAVAFEAIESSDDLVDDAQPLESGCTLLRPAGWSGPGIHCAEYFLPPGGTPGTLPMSNGQSFITGAGYTFPAPGYGFARISCNNGSISIESLSCTSGIIP